MSKWIRKDDKVLIIAGNDKGKTGVVLARIGDKVVVQGVNVKKKHEKKRTANAPSAIVEREFPVHVSNVALCDAEGKRIKLKVRVDNQGNKDLFFVDGGKEVVHRQVHKHK